MYDIAVHQSHYKNYRILYQLHDKTYKSHDDLQPFFVHFHRMNYNVYVLFHDTNYTELDLFLQINEAYKAKPPQHEQLVITSVWGNAILVFVLVKSLGIVQVKSHAP